MKIYLASSWKNEELVRDWASVLREKGHEVDAFCDTSTGRTVFGADKNYNFDDLTAPEFLKVEKAQRAYAEDKKWLEWADVCILILPSGKSSHLEAGYAKGQGKKLVIYQNKFPAGEWDVMYGFADLISDDPLTIMNFLKGG